MNFLWLDFDLKKWEREKLEKQKKKAQAEKAKAEREKSDNVLIDYRSTVFSFFLNCIMLKTMSLICELVSSIIGRIFEELNYRLMGFFLKLGCVPET